MQDYLNKQQTTSFHSIFHLKNNAIDQFRSIALVVLFLVFPMLSKAALEQHITWKSSVEKISETEYNVKFSCNLDDGWHTFSQFTKEGGPLPTQFRFEKNKDLDYVSPDGSSSEHCRLRGRYSHSCADCQCVRNRCLWLWRCWLSVIHVTAGRCHS